MEITGDAMWKLQCKLKTLSKKLSQWSRESIGDVHDQIRIWEGKIQELEELDLLHNTGRSREDLNKGHAEYIRWLNMQDSIYRQKAHIKWFKEGDCNSKFFHSILRIKRNKLSIHRIKNRQGNWIQGEEKITKAAINHFENMFNLDRPTIDQSLMNYIPSLINAEDNELLNRMPDEEEIKESIFSMSPTSAAGPDGYNGKFFQVCWTIIKHDIIDFVWEFCKGKSLTKFYTHTCVALIPKVDNPASFSDLRPISLSNFTNKIISKIISKRLNPLLPRLIYVNQSGFVSGRLITENVMLAQEIIHNISKINSGGNVVLKLDMAKAYDRLSWEFQENVLKKYDFANYWISLVSNLISNV